MPTLGSHFSDEEAALVEKAAQAAGQKTSPYIAEAIRSRMLKEGQIPGTKEAHARKVFEDLLRDSGAEVVTTALENIGLSSLKD